MKRLFRGFLLGLGSYALFQVLNAARFLLVGEDPCLAGVLGIGLLALPFRVDSLALSTMRPPTNVPRLLVEIVGAYAFLWGFVVLSAFVGLSPISAGLPSAERAWERVFLLVGWAALVEEIVFRWALFLWGRRLELAPSTILVVSAASFGLAHPFPQTLAAAAVGLWLAVSYLRSGSLWDPIIRHAAINVLGGIFPGYPVVLPPSP